jgi:hypothetical protein
MDTLVALATGFSALNVVILLVLLSVYVRIASRAHAAYTYGLMIFSGLLLGQNSLMVYVCGFLTGLYNWQLYPFFDALTVLEFVGLVALLRITI